MENEKNKAKKTNKDAEIEALKAELEALKKAQAEKDAAPKQNAVRENQPKTVKVRLPRQKDNNEDVFVSVNNYTCIVKRGVEVEVPDFVAEVLRHQEEALEEIMLFEQAHAK